MVFYEGYTWPPLRKATSYSFIIRVVELEEQFPVGPKASATGSQFPPNRSFPTRQIAFEFSWCSFRLVRNPPQNSEIWKISGPHTV